MAKVHEIRIASPHTGIEVPEGLKAGSTFTVHCELKVDSLPLYTDTTTTGELTLNCTAIDWNADVDREAVLRALST